jgi:ABC-type branched-subunit amino acid transport system ATPase component
VKRLLEMRAERAARRARAGTVRLSMEQAESPGKMVFEADNIGKSFADRVVVRDFSTRILRGDRIGLIGPNGAGKTTALNVLSGYYRPSAGRVALGDTALVGLPAHRIARAGVARTYQTSQLFGSISAVDNVVLAGLKGRLGGLLSTRALRSAPARDRALALLRACGYRGDPDARASDLPHVDRRLVEIARALATDPAVLLLDEPAAGLTGEDKAHLATLLREIADWKIALVLVEHDMALVMPTCTTIAVLDAGRRIALGSPAEIRADPVVRNAYLGEIAQAPPPGVARATTGAGELLGVNRLGAGYGTAPVLHDVSLAVKRGEAVALLGANGAGKSTLMRVLAGLHRPVRGGIAFDGVDLAPLSARRAVRLGLVLVPEGRQVFPELSVRDNLRLGAFRVGERNLDADIEAMLARFPRLRERIDQRAGLLSGGEQQMLALARGLMARPSLMLLDEPSLGLAPKIIAELFTALDRLREEGVSMLLVDQMAALALRIADRAYVMESGRIVMQGAAREVAGDPALARAYLGQ